MFRPLLLENERRKLIQTAPPRQPLMSRLRRIVVDALHAGFLQSFDIGLACLAPALLASIADEHNLDLFLERVHVGYLSRRNAASAKDPDVRELIEVSQ